MEDRSLLSTVIGLTTTNTLVRFDSATPGTVTAIGAVTGLTGADALVGIDVRPATGQLYGLGFNFASVGTEGQLYTINPVTAVAAPVGSRIAMPQAIGSTLNAVTSFGFDFNPVADAIRVVSTGRDNFRLNPTTGAIAGADTLLTPGGSMVVGAAYTNSFAGATSTTLYDIDISTSPDQLVIQGGNPVPPGASPNGGVLTVVGSLGAGIDSTGAAGFDIEQGTGTAYAVLTVGGVAGLYTINLGSGLAALVNPIGGGLALRDITVAQATQFAITGLPATGTAGTANSFTVTAQDPFGLTATGYNGTAAFSSTDPAVQPPANATLTNGTGNFTATFNTAGVQSLTATDSRIAALTGTAMVSVSAAASVPSEVGLFAVGTGPGAPAQVNVYDANGTLRFTLTPYGPFRGGVTVATADVTGDGRDDIIVGAGTSAPGGHVKVFDGLNGTEIRSFLTFPGFLGGVVVAAGDVNGDDRADIVVGASGSVGGHVKVFDGQSLTLLQSFLAFPGFAGGVSVAVGDINGDDRADVIVGAAGANGHVKVFDGQSLTLQQSFLAFPGFSGGISVSAGDIDGDGRDDIITGAGASAPDGHVKVFSGLTGSQIRSFLSFSGFLGGVRVAAGDRDGDGRDDIFTAAGPSTGPHVKCFGGLSGAVLDSFFAFDPAFLGGVSIG